MVHRSFSVIHTGRIDILLWDTKIGMAFGTITTAVEGNISEYHPKPRGKLAKDVFVTLSKRN